MIKKLVLSIAALVSIVSVAYAGCWQTQNFNKTVDYNNMRRLVLQCTAMRAGGGNWTISSGDTFMTKSGVTYSTQPPVWNGSFYTMDVKNGGTTIATATWTSNGYADMNYFVGGSEAGWCTFEMVGVPNNPPQPPTMHQEARYCR